MFQVLVFALLSTAIAQLNFNLPHLRGKDFLEEYLHDSGYVYQQSSMKDVNWLYLGFAPRAKNSDQVELHFSKLGKTMRVRLQMSPEQVAAYPRDLLERRNNLIEALSVHQLRVPQEYRLISYLSSLNPVEETLESIAPGDTQAMYQLGYDLLTGTFFPGNVFTVGSDGALEVNFVYPITVNKAGTGWPRDGTFYTQAFEERRSHYTKGTGIIKNHIFAGYPAFWFDQTGAGTGVHGPIRYMNPDESRNSRQKAPYGNDAEGIHRFWSENHYLGEEVDPRTGLTVRHRFEIVRTNDSAGCFRALTLELRHILPSNEAEVRRVPMFITSKLDTMNIDGEERFVDVNHYAISPYQKPLTQREWIQKEIAKDQSTVDKLTQQAYTFPLLDPATIEFLTPQNGSSYKIMSELNKY